MREAVIIALQPFGPCVERMDARLDCIADRSLRCAIVETQQNEGQQGSLQNQQDSQKQLTFA